jgi:hypothetical protein
VPAGAPSQRWLGSPRHPDRVVSWQELYATDLQGLYAVWVVPLLFFGFLLLDLRRRRSRVAIVPQASAFLRAYALAFTLETMLDPLAGGPVLRWLGLADRPVALVVVFFFVLLGDFRVFLLVLGLAALATGRPLRPAVAAAAAWSFIVPLATFAIHGTLGAIAGTQPSQSLWLIYELGFLAMTFVLRHHVVPARVPAAQPGLRAYLHAVLAYVALYYALWATADALILASGADLAWALRMIPNQLYYALYVPFVYALAFSRRYAANSSSTQSSR